MNNIELLHIRGLTIDWDRIGPASYLRRRPSIFGLDKLDFHNSITFFVGENGSGKSTLLEAIAVEYGFNPAEKQTRTAALSCDNIL